MSYSCCWHPTKLVLKVRRPGFQKLVVVIDNGHHNSCQWLRLLLRGPCCRLGYLATSRLLNLQHLDVEAIAGHLLPEKLPAFKVQEVTWQPPSGDAEPSEQWLRLLWKKLEVRLQNCLQAT